MSRIDHPSTTQHHHHVLIVVIACCCSSLYFFFHNREAAATDESSDSNHQLTRHQTNVIHALSGSLGSALSITLLYPLETVRTRLQVSSTSTTTAKKSQHQLWSFQHILKIYKNEGIQIGLYRGYYSLLISLMILNFIYFYCFHWLRKVVLQYVLYIGGEHDDGDGYDDNNNVMVDLVAGYLAGCIAVIVTGPLWLVNTRLKLQGVVDDDGDVNSKKEDKDQQHQQYHGIIHCLYTIYQQEGLSTLWKGTFTSIILSLNPAIQLAAYEMLKRQHIVSWIIAHSMIGLKHHYPLSNISSSKSSGGSSSSSGAVEHFINALLSKFVATLITYPMQLLQTRQRWSSSSSTAQQRQEKYSQPPPQDNGNIPNKSSLPKSKQEWSLIATILSVIQDLQRIIQQQGIHGLYRGLESKLIQTCLNSALMFVAYETLVELLTKLLHITI